MSLLLALLLSVAHTPTKSEALTKLQAELDASIRRTRAEFTRTHPHPFYCTCGPQCPTPVAGKWPIPASMVPVKR